MKRSFAVFIILISLSTAAHSASGKQPAPAGAFDGAPAEYTRFSAAEITRGFLALAFGSDLRIGLAPRGIRRFDQPIRVAVVAGGSVDRSAAMTRVVEEYARKVPNLHLSIAAGTQAAEVQPADLQPADLQPANLQPADLQPADLQPADLEVRLIDEKNFKSALRAAFGVKVTRAFVARTDPQCMTSVKSNADGEIVRTVSFIIVDKGDDVFLDCAYHELLHAFGLSNHDQRNPWTTLNQKRMVGYLSVYDRALLTLLYDPRLMPGMTAAQARAVLPKVITDLGLAESPNKSQKVR